jgi:hypothetical protein
MACQYNCGEYSHGFHYKPLSIIIINLILPHYLMGLTLYSQRFFGLIIRLILVNYSHGY